MGTQKVSGLTKSRKGLKHPNAKAALPAWIIPAGKLKPVTATWPRFERVIIPPKCCPGCGHILEGPKAGAITIADDMGMPDFRSPLFDKRRDSEKAAAMRLWLESPAGKAWKRHKAKPTTATYRALVAAGGAA